MVYCCFTHISESSVLPLEKMLRRTIPRSTGVPSLKPGMRSCPRTGVALRWYPVFAPMACWKIHEMIGSRENIVSPNCWVSHWNTTEDIQLPCLIGMFGDFELQNLLGVCRYGGTCRLRCQPKTKWPTELQKGRASGLTHRWYPEYSKNNSSAGGIGDSRGDLYPDLKVPAYICLHK